MKIGLGAAVGAAAMAAFVTPAFAGNEVSATYRHLDYDTGGDADQYNIGVQSGRDWARFGGEFETTDREGVNDTYLGVVNGGVNLAGPMDVIVKPRLELGYRYQRGGDDDLFWGAGMTVQRPIVGPVNAVVSYRYRDSFNGDYTSSRWTAGVNAALTDRLVGAVNWLHDSEAEYNGLGVTLSLEM